MNNEVMTVDCSEPEGLIARTVSFTPLSVEKLRELWGVLSQYPTLFNRHISTQEDFVTSLISEDSNGNPKANGLVWEVDDVGILYLTDIYPVFQATGHFTFWDGRFKGRELLILKMLEYVFEEFGFHRIITEVPFYAQPTMGVVDRIGFVREGRLRKATRYRDEWWDVASYSMLREESKKYTENFDALTQEEITEVGRQYAGSEGAEGLSHRQLANKYGLTKAHIAFLIQS